MEKILENPTWLLYHLEPKNVIALISSNLVQVRPSKPDRPGRSSYLNLVLNLVDVLFELMDSV